LAGGWRRRCRCARRPAAATPRTSGLPGPVSGGIPLAALTAGDVQAMFTAIIRDEIALGRPVSAATLQEFLTVEQAAEVLQVSRDNVYGLIRTRQLRSIKVRRLRRISRRWVTQFVRRRPCPQLPRSCRPGPRLRD
jgi:excisionase family DNA binding protein